MSGDEMGAAFFAGNDGEKGKEADEALWVDDNGFVGEDWFDEARAQAGKGEDGGRPLDELKEAFAGEQKADAARQGDALKASMAQAQDAQPEDEAKIRALARQFDAPPELARRYRAQFEAQARNERMESLSAAYPKTAAYLSEPGHARLAHDDVDNITALEAMFAQPEGFSIAGDFGARADKARLAPLDFTVDAARNLAAGAVGGAIKTAGAAVSYLARSLPVAGVNPEGALYYPEALTGDEQMARYGEAERVGKELAASSGADQLYRFGKETEEAIAGEGMGEYGFAGRALLSGFRSLGNMIPAAAGSFVTGSPALSLVFAGVSEGGEAFMDDVLGGESLGKATLHGMVNGGIEAATEFLPLSKLIKEAAAGTPFVSLFLRNWARETPSELVATAGQTLSDRIAGMKEGEDAGDVFLKWLSELPENELETAISVIPMSLGFSGMARVHQAREARALKKTVEMFNRLAGESRLRSRSPEDYAVVADFMGQTSGVTHAYIDAGKWITYFQGKGIDPKEAAEQYGALNYAEAAGLGVSLMIPFGRYQTGFSGSEHAAAFSADTKFDERALTAAEGEEQKAKNAPNTALLAVMLNELGQESKTAGALGKAVEQLTDEVAMQLVERFGWDDARVQASISARAFVHPIFRELMARAEEAGKTVSPEALVDDVRRRFINYGLIVDANAKEGAWQYGQPLNAGVKLDTQVPVIPVTPQFQGQDPKMVRKRFPKAIREKVLAAFKEGVTNEQTGITVGMSGNDFTEHLHFKDDATGDAHLEAIAVLPELMRTARLIESHSGKKTGDEENLTQVHRFISALRVGSKDYAVMLTVKEFKDGKAVLNIENPVRLYHHRVEKSLSSVTSASFPIEQAGSWTTPEASTYTIRDLLSGVKDAYGSLYFPSSPADATRQYGQPVTQGFYWEYGQREGLFDLPDVPVVRISGTEFGEDRKAIQAGAMAHLNALRSGAPIRNQDTKWALQISRNDWSKIAKNPEKSLEALQAVFAIEQLAANAVLAETHEDEKHRNPDVPAIHRMYAPIEINGVLYRAKLTVKDYTGVSSGEKTNLHDIDTIEIESAPLGTLPTRLDVPTRTAQPTTGRSLSISEAESGEVEAGKEKPGDAITLTNPSETAKTGTPTGLAPSISEAESGEIDTAEKESALLGTLPTKLDTPIKTAQPTTGRTLSISALLAGSSRHDGTPWDTRKASEREEGYDGENTRAESEAAEAQAYEQRRFAAGANPGAGRQAKIGIEEVRQIAKELAAEYGNAPELVVVEKPGDLPFDALEDAKGVYWGGRCFLVASNLNTAEDAKSTFAHEVIGHYGIHGFFGNQFASELNDILFHNKNVQAAAWKWIKDNADFIRDVRRKKAEWSHKRFAEWRMLHATEEALAQMAERGEKVTGVKKLVHAIQKCLRFIGLWQLANRLEARTDAEALMALHKAELFVRSGKNADTATVTDVYALFARKGGGQASGYWPGETEDYSERGFTASASPGEAEQAEANRQYDEVVAKYRGTNQWMKAPNGKPTKLTERQWVQVRTPNFKGWLGFDWERESDAPGLLQALRDNESNPEGIEGESGTADSELRYAKLQMDALVPEARAALPERNAGRERDIRERAGRALGRLALLDPATGEPQVYYHGSKADISAFDIHHPNKKDKGWLGKGIYFTNEAGLADEYTRIKKGEAGQNIMPLFVRMRNPYIVSLDEKKTLGIRTEEQAEERTAELIRQGYDGIVAYNFNFPDWIDAKEVVVFSPEQVKSAISNTGTFSETPHILYQRQGPVPVSSAGRPAEVGIEEVRQIVKELAAEYGNAPELVVVEKPGDLPFDALEDAKGVYWGGRCFLVQRNITSAEDAREVFGHEVIGHFGLRGFFGERLSRLLDKIFIHNRNVREAVQKWIKNNPDYIRQVRSKKPGWSQEKFTNWIRHTAIEEALAQMAGRGEKVTGVKKLVHVIQKLLRAIGLEQLANRLEARTDAEALMALHKAELFVKSGKNADTATVTDVYALFARHNRTAIYRQQVDELIEGKRQSASLGMPSKALLDSGVANVRLQITKDVVDKVEEKHGISIGQLKALPDLLEHPVMVFQSATDGGHVVVLDDTAIAEDGKTMPLIVAIRPNGRVTVNYVRSVYARSNFAQAAFRWAEAGLLVSAQKKAAVDLINLYSQRGKTSGADRIINSGKVKSLPESAPSGKQGDDVIAFSRKGDGQAWPGAAQKETAVDLAAQFSQRGRTSGAGHADLYSQRGETSAAGYADFYSQRGRTSAADYAINSGKAESLPEGMPSGKQGDDFIDFFQEAAEQAWPFSSEGEDALDENPRILYQFIGEKGAAELDRAEEATVRLDNLAVAREMEAAGRKAKLIKLATGWERGADGKWRYEISDAFLRLNLPESGQRTLGEALVHPELFTAYPDLKGLLVVRGPILSPAGAAAFLDGDTIFVDDGLSVRETRSALLHEVQHAIQEREGFARGASPDMFETNEKGLVDTGRKRRRYVKPDMAYKAAAGEVEARNTQRRAFMTPELRMYLLAEETEDVARKDQIFLQQAMAPGALQAEKGRQGEAHAYEQRGFTASASPSAAEQAEANRQYDEIVEKYKGTALWMKAPNGEPTKLTEQQWVQARTANFKEVFGDWEKAGIRERLEAQVPVEVEAKFTEEAADISKNAAAKLLPEPITVEKIIGDVLISRNGIRESIHHSRNAAKLDVIPYLKEILEQAEYLDTLNDFTGKEIKNHYFATRIQHGGQTKLVFLRVRERINTRQLYVHDVFIEDDVKKASSLQTSPLSRKDLAKIRGTGLYKAILQEVYSTVNLSISNIVDKNGEPAASCWGKGEALQAREGQAVVSLDGTELGVLMDAPLKEHIAAAKRFHDALAKEIESGKTLQQPELEKPVRLSSRGWRKNASSGANKLKWQLFPKLREIIEGSRLVDTKTARGKYAEHYTKWHWCETPVLIKGEERTVGFALLEDAEGNLFYNLNADPQAESPRKHQRSSHGPGAADTGTGILGQSMADDADGVNLSLREGWDVSGKQGTLRGAFSISPDRKMRIALFKDANYSTFVHETAHFMLEVYRDLASEPGASAYIKKEYATILRYLGAKPGQPITRRQHEKFARAFERYLMEGKAPSVAMRDVFSRFKAWLLDIYKSFNSLNAPLSDDIRAVFDRMLATDGEIAFMRQAREMAPLFASARAMGAGDEAFAAYEAAGRLEWQTAADALRASAMRQRLREETREYRKAYEQMRQRAARAYDAQPAAKALYALTSHAGFSLNAARLRQVYGEDFISLLPVMEGRRIYDEKGDLLPEDAAAMLGFDSGDAMIQAIAQLPAREAYIREEARRLMLAREAEALRGETMAALLEDALGNAHRLERLKAELGFLARLGKAGEGLSDAAVAAQCKAMQEEAAAFVLGKQVKDMKPSLYFQAMQAAAQKARAAIERTQPNYGEAIRQKRAELMNLLLYREASRVLLAVRDGLAQAEAIAARPLEAACRTRDALCVDKARQLAAQLLSGGEADAPWKGMRAEGAEGQADGEAVFDGRVAGPVDGMQAATALDALRTVQAYWDLARRLQVMDVDGTRVALSRAAGAVAARLRTFGRAAGRKGLPAVLAEDGVMSVFGGLRWHEARMAAFCRQADDLMAGEDAGPLARYVFEPVRRAAVEARRAQEAALGRLDALLSGFGFVRETIAAPELGMTFGKKTGYGKAELVHALLCAGCVSGMEDLAAGLGRDGFAGGRPDTRRWDAFLLRMASEGRLTRADYDRMQAIWDVFAGFLPRWQQAHEALFGRAFDEAEGRPFTAFGKAYRGGFVPAAGFGPDGAGERSVPFVPDMALLRQQLGEMVMFAFVAPAGRDVSRLLEEDEVQAAFGLYAPGMLDTVVKPWLACAMRPYEAAPGEGLTVLDGWTEAGRLRAGAAALLDAGADALGRQGMGAALLGRVKLPYVTAAFREMAKDRAQAAQAVAAASSYMQGRMRANLAAFSEGVGKNGTPAADAGLLAAAADMFCAPVVWAAAYHQASVEGGLDRAAAVKSADEAVQQALGDAAGGRLAWQDGGALLQAASLFGAYFAGGARAGGHAVQRQAAAVLLQAAMLPVWSGEAICRAVDGRVGGAEAEAFGSWLKDAFGWGAMDGEGLSLAGRAVPPDGAGGQRRAALSGPVFYPPFVKLTEAAFQAMGWAGEDGAFDAARFAQDMAAFGEAACGLDDIAEGEALEAVDAFEAWEAEEDIPLFSRKAQADGEQTFYQQDQAEENGERGYTASANPGAEEQAEANRQYDEIVEKYKGTALWMKAPNGEPTNLTERQWVQARTANFKEVFGDWETVARISAVRSMPVMEVEQQEPLENKKALESVFRELKSVKNKDGTVATLPVATAGKVFGHRSEVGIGAISRSISALFQSAELAYTRKEEQRDGHKKHNNVKEYRHYVNKFGLNGKEYYIRFTVRMLTDNSKHIHSTAISDVSIYGKTDQSRRIHTGLVPREGQERSVEKNPSPAIHTEQTSGDIIQNHIDKRLSEWFESVNPDSVSKVVDENGEPAASYWGEG